MAADPSLLDGGGAETVPCLFRGALELFKMRKWIQPA